MHGTTYYFLNRPGTLDANVCGKQMLHELVNSFGDQCRNHSFGGCDQTNNIFSGPTLVSKIRKQHNQIVIRICNQYKDRLQ